MVVTDFLVEQFPKILDLKFTAHMEDELDDIAIGQGGHGQGPRRVLLPVPGGAARPPRPRAERVQIPTDETCHVCGAPMVLKFGRTGQFLGCSKYPECKATRPIGGQPRAEAVESEHACPKCGKPLMIRENKRGEKFLSCSGYPECKESFNIDERATPCPRSSRPSTPARSAASRWPCGRARGAVPGLHRVSQVPQRDARGRPGQAGPAGEGRGPLREVRRHDGRAQGRRGSFLGCTNYPKCRGTAPVPDDLKEQLAEQAPAAAAAARPQVDPVEETCEQCGGPMIVRRSRRGFFLGCASIPNARGPASRATRRWRRSTPWWGRDVHPAPLLAKAKRILTIVSIFGFRQTVPSPI